MKTVLQIMIGEIPEHLRFCVDSVKTYAYKHSADYIVLRETDREYDIEPLDVPETHIAQYQYNRLLSELMRMKYLSENAETIYCDWDIYLYDCLPIPVEEMFAEIADSMIYNAGNTERYRQIYDEIKDKKWKAGHCIIATYLWKMAEQEPKPSRFDGRFYRHFFEADHQMHNCPRFRA